MASHPFNIGFATIWLAGIFGLGGFTAIVNALALVGVRTVPISGNPIAGTFVPVALIGAACALIEYGKRRTAEDMLEIQRSIMAKLHASKPSMPGTTAAPAPPLIL